MTDFTEPNWDVVARRYRLGEQAEWRKLLTHFSLSKDFDFVVLLVPEAEGAALCRRELENHLQKSGRVLSALEFAMPADLHRLPEHFLEEACGDEIVCLWVAAVVPDYAPDYREWHDAWEQALARLNAFRNPIRKRFKCTLIFVGAPWLQPVMREVAPDLWSVRTIVVNIELVRPIQIQGESKVVSRGNNAIFSPDAADPIFALQQAEKLRGVEGKELTLASLLHRVGQGFEAQNNWPEAAKSYAESLELKDQHGASSRNVLTTIIEFSWAVLFLGEASRALKLAERAVTIAHEIGDQHGEGNAMSILGNASIQLGEIQRAIYFYEQALSIDREIGDRRGEGIDLSNLGIAYMNLGEIQRAINFYEQALSIAREIGDLINEGTVISNLGIAYMNLGEIQRAINFYEQALNIARKIGDLRGEGIAIGNLGTAYTNLGEIQRAINFYEQALNIARKIGDRRNEGSTIGNLGNAYEGLGEWRRAIDFYEQALHIAREIGDLSNEGGALWNIGVVLDLLGEREQAIKCVTSALVIFEQIESPDATTARQQLEKWSQESENKEGNDLDGSPTTA